MRGWFKRSVALLAVVAVMAMACSAKAAFNLDVTNSFSEIGTAAQGAVSVGIGQYKEILGVGLGIAVLAMLFGLIRRGVRGAGR